MPRGVKTRSTPDPSDLITQEEAAAYFDVTPPMITKWKKAGYEGFYAGGVYLPELIRSWGKEQRERGKAEGDGESEDRIPSILASVIAAAKGKVLRYQIDYGKTIYVDDVIELFDAVNQEYRNASQRVAPTLAGDLSKWLSTEFVKALPPAERAAVQKALALLDQRLFTLAIGNSIDKDLGRVGKDVADVVTKAIAKSRLK